MGYITKTLRPNIDTACATAYDAADILFDWTPIEIPAKGALKLASISGTIAGTNTNVSNELDMDLLFAVSIDGVAPTSLGTVNGATTKAATAACRRNMVGSFFFDASKGADSGDDLLGFNLYGFATSLNTESIMIQGEPSERLGGTHGYQTIYVAAMAQGAFDFGTGVTLNETDAATLLAGGTAALDVADVDPRLVFAVGDEIIAADGALLGVIESIPSDVLINLTATHTDALENDDEICFRQPMRLELGFEY
jgi:hypothetical protein